MPLAKVVLTSVDNPSVTIRAQYNPSEYTITKENTWTPKPVIGRNIPQLDFTGGGSRTMNVKLFFDVFEQPGASIESYTDTLWQLTLINENDSARGENTQRSRPHILTIQFGETWHFRCVITNLSVQHTLFRQDGTPVRAEATLTLKEVADDNDQPAQNPTSHAEPGTKRRTVRPDDTLPTIAFEEYGDANQWRKIAEANEIDNPRGLFAGQILKIPPRN